MTQSPPPKSGKISVPAGSSLRLSPREVERLLNEDAPDIRIELVRTLAGDHGGKRYSLREMAIAEQIFRLLVRDTEQSVRETLSETLKDNPAVPHDIIAALARDCDAVALPVIAFSLVLTDADLLLLIESARTPARPMAIAGRAEVSEPVTSALLKIPHTPTVSKLVKNPGASFHDGLYDRLVHDHSAHKDVMEALASRPNLPATVVEKIIAFVSDSIAQKLRETYGLAPQVAAAETDKSREMATLKLVDAKLSEYEMAKLIDQLHLFGRLTPSLILTSLCRSHLSFFEASLARLSGIPVQNARLLIHDKGGLGFRALYSKAGLPEKFFQACLLLLHTVAERARAGKSHDAGAVIQALFAAASGQPVENLSYLIALIRQQA